jgi:hypothetical protein
MPLPPASGSPIGYLLDDAGPLGLNDSQLGQLREIDDTLAAHLEELDATDRAGNAPPPGQAPSGGRGRRGGMHGGMRGGGGGMSGGGMSGGGMSGGGMSGGGSGGPGGGRGGPGGGPHGHHGGGPAGGAAASIAEERTLYVRDALGKAFGVMDAAQRAKAKQFLADKGVDLDAPPPGEPGAGGEGKSGDDEGSDEAPVPVEP